MTLIWTIFLPLIGAAGILVGRGRHEIAWIGVATNCGVVALGISTAIHAARASAEVGANGLLRADSLSAFMVIVIGTIALLASWVGVHTMALELDAAQTTVRGAMVYAVLVQVFVATMLLAVVAANVAVLWVAIEATTVVTTFLVGHRRSRASLEASWKYIVICSTGIALAFLGTVLVYLAALHAGGTSAGALDWTSLMNSAHRLDARTMRLAFALLVLGYGTKVGLAPMHSWLPDAHSQAPAPISALMSGVLLTVAFYAILRFKAITDLAVGVRFGRDLLVIAGLLSLVVAASLLIAQRDYKRMLAYSSIEHMGLIALGAAAGVPLAIAAVLLHILGHGLTKSVLFLSSGEIMAAEGTTRIDGIHSLLSRRPTLGGIFGVGLVALLGLPPFSLFSSELMMLRAEFSVGLGWAAIVAVIAMLAIFISLVGHSRDMLFGTDASLSLTTVASDGALITVASVEASSIVAVPSDPPAWVSAPLVVGISVCGLIGLFAWPLSGLLQDAARVIAR